MGNRNSTKIIELYPKEENNNTSIKDYSSKATVWYAKKQKGIYKIKYNNIVYYLDLSKSQPIGTKDNNITLIFNIIKKNNHTEYISLPLVCELIKDNWKISGITPLFITN